MIIHILGPSGAGKTTLGKKIQKNIKNTVVIDTDDIDDPNSIKLLNKYSFNNKSDLSNLIKELEKKNKKDLVKILKDYKNKHLIFVGFFHAGMNFMEKKINQGYVIKINSEKLWRQYNLRTAQKIHNNFSQIKKLLNGKTNPEKIHFIFSKKFGIRNGFDCSSPQDLEQFIKIQKQEAKTKKYIYDTNNKIYQHIKKLLN